MPLCSVFAFPHHGIDTWTPEPSRPVSEPGRQEQAPGQAAAHGPGWPRQRWAAAGFPSGSRGSACPGQAQAGKQTEQQMLCEILGLELFFFF